MKPTTRKPTAKQVAELAKAATQLLLNTHKTPFLAQSCDRLRAALEPFAPAPKVVTVNAAQRLYVIPEGHGFSCLGFDVVIARRNAVVEWLRQAGKPVDGLISGERGSLEAYASYTRTLNRAAVYCRDSGKRCPCELTPQLLGLEGQRVEVTDSDGQRRRFRVGKSTGWMPCHLEIYRRNIGGPAVMGAPFQSVRVLKTRQYA